MQERWAIWKNKVNSTKQLLTIWLSWNRQIFNLQYFESPVIFWDWFQWNLGANLFRFCTYKQHYLRSILTLPCLITRTPCCSPGEKVAPQGFPCHKNSKQEHSAGKLFDSRNSNQGASDRNVSRVFHAHNLWVSESSKNMHFHYSNPGNPSRFPNTANTRHFLEAWSLFWNESHNSEFSLMEQKMRSFAFLWLFDMLFKGLFCYDCDLVYVHSVCKSLKVCQVDDELMVHIISFHLFSWSHSLSTLGCHLSHCHPSLSFPKCYFHHCHHQPVSSPHLPIKQRMHKATYSKKVSNT